MALFKRMKTSGSWLAWIGAELCRSWREAPRLPETMRLRAVDSTTVQRPASKSSEWRVHYALDLNSLNYDWFELTDTQGTEQLERTPMLAGDVMLADRNYLRNDNTGAQSNARFYAFALGQWVQTSTSFITQPNRLGYAHDTESQEPRASWTARGGQVPLFMTHYTRPGQKAARDAWPPTRQQMRAS